MQIQTDIYSYAKRCGVNILSTICVYDDAGKVPADIDIEADTGKDVDRERERAKKNKSITTHTHIDS